MTDSSSVYRRRAGVIYRVVDGEAVIVRTDASEVLGLDPVGTRTLELIDGGRSLAEVVSALAAEYDVERAQLEHDIAAFVGELIDGGVLERVDAP